MKKNKIKARSLIGGGIGSLLIIPFVSSCSSYSEIINYDLKTQMSSWYEQIENVDWSDDEIEAKNFYCDNEGQAIYLYSIEWGWFWNEYLHSGEEPIDQTVDLRVRNTKGNIRGEDYKLVSEALQQSTINEELTVWHGVEYMEVEFYEQLSDYIKPIEDNEGNIKGYDYSSCINKTITSYGLISTTLDEQLAKKFSQGEIFNDRSYGHNEYYLPLKEPVMFKIKIQKGYKGASYLANYKWVGYINYDNQVLIDRGCQFKINSIYTQNDINVFEVELLDS